LSKQLNIIELNGTADLHVLAIWKQAKQKQSFFAMLITEILKSYQAKLMSLNKLVCYGKCAFKTS